MISLRSTCSRRILYSFAAGEKLSARGRFGLKGRRSGKIRLMSSKNTTGDDTTSTHNHSKNSPLQKPAGPLWTKSICESADDEGGTTLIKPDSSEFFIPQVALSDHDGRMKKRVLVLCTGGTLTMAPDPKQGGGE